MKKGFSKLSPITQVVIVIVIIVIIFLLIRSGKSFFQGLSNKASDTAESLSLGAQGQQKTFTDAEYKQQAGQLYNAMAGMGTNESVIMSVFGKQQNDRDIVELNSAFGIRDSYDLQAWLSGDLGESELQDLNNMLANKGITKQF